MLGHIAAFWAAGALVWRHLAARAKVLVFVFVGFAAMRAVRTHVGTVWTFKVVFLALPAGEFVTLIASIYGSAFVAASMAFEFLWV